MRGPVYVITDPAAPLPVARQALAAAQGGAAMVQIRDKTASDAQIAACVTWLLPQCAALGTRVIVNDRAEVAIATGADGLHIGQGDGDPVRLRAALPPGMILGLSVENAMQARAVPPGVAYIGAGPLRATATKPDHAPPIGFDGLAQIIAACPLPAYAIGGLGLADVARLKSSGAAGIAVVSAVARAADPAQATAALVTAWRRA